MPKQSTPGSATLLHLNFHGKSPSEISTGNSLLKKKHIHTKYKQWAYNEHCSLNKRTGGGGTFQGGGRFGVSLGNASSAWGTP